MAQRSAFPSGILELQYFRFVRLLVNLIESGIFITTFLLKGCNISLKCSISCVCNIIKYWHELSPFISINLVMIMNFEK